MTLPRLQSQTRDPKVKRKFPSYLAWVRKHMCCVPGCGFDDIEAAHVRSGTDGGASLKPADWWAISLCQAHHAEQHQIGEPAFERKYNIDMKTLATEFAQKSPNQQVRMNAGTKAGLK